MLQINDQIYAKVLSNRFFKQITKDDIIWGYNYAKSMPENAHPENILNENDLLKLSAYMSYFGYEEQQKIIDEGGDDYKFDPSVL